MRRRIKSLLSIWILITICFSSITFSYGAIQVPQKIRIGLYFEDTATISVNLSGAKGIQLGNLKDNKFTVLYEEPTGDIITLRKDTYFISVNNTLKEYDPTAKGAPKGIRTGPFHIKIGGNYPNLDTAMKQVTALKQKDITAYPVYTDVWQVWTGFYIDEKVAQTDITTNLSKKPDMQPCSIIKPLPSSIVALKNNSDIAMIFASTTGVLQVHPKKENNPYIIKVNNTNYRGDIEVRRFTGSDMMVINILSMEEYLYGVVPSELESTSPLESLKAQAVAARTYAIGSMGKHSEWSFDLCNGTGCQVYKGFNGEAQSTNKAVNDTKGKKLTYNGKLAQTFYFSSCGGRTENVKNVWGSEIPYLKSVEDKYESGNTKNYNWEYSITAAKVKEVMLGRGFNLGDIINMCVTKRSEAGRAIEFVIEGTKGERVYTNDGCRNVFSLASQSYNISTDADVLVMPLSAQPTKTYTGNKKVVTAGGVKVVSATNKSVSILGADTRKKAVSAVPNNYVFVGKGWGHAVGMSQDGARGMAKAGFTYDKILTHYFQGTKVE